MTRKRHLSRGNPGKSRGRTQSGHCDVWDDATEAKMMAVGRKDKEERQALTQSKEKAARL